jgi:DnaJ-class molecular chaperone
MEITFTRLLKFPWSRHWWVEAIATSFHIAYSLYGNRSFDPSHALRQTGFSLTLKQLDGEKFDVNIEDVVESDEVVRIPGKGMPRRSGRGFGDLYLKLEVDFPDKLSPEQKKAIKAALDPSGSAESHSEL